MNRKASQERLRPAVAAGSRLISCEIATAAAINKNAGLGLAPNKRMEFLTHTLWPWGIRLGWRYAGFSWAGTMAGSLHWLAKKRAAPPLNSRYRLRLSTPRELAWVLDADFPFTPTAKGVDQVRALKRANPAEAGTKLAIVTGSVVEQNVA